MPAIPPIIPSDCRTHISRTTNTTMLSKLLIADAIGIPHEEACDYQYDDNVHQHHGSPVPLLSFDRSRSLKPSSLKIVPGAS